jgi:hypothetical protein
VRVASAIRVGRKAVTEVKTMLWRTRIAVLWIFLAVGMSASLLLWLASPGALGELMEGRAGEEEITTAMMIFVTLFWLVPLTMAFLTLVLRDPVNRYANAGVSVVATGMWIWDVIEHLAGEGFSAATVVTAAMILAGLGILWHAWKWPEERAEKQPGEAVSSIPAERVSAVR